MRDASETRGKAPPAGAIDCDVHPAIVSTRTLMPYLDEHWREQVVQRGIDGLDPSAFPAKVPANGRPDWRPANGYPGSDPRKAAADVLDAFQSRFAILNCLYPVQAVYDEYMAASMARALNEWVAKEWLDLDARFRASIVVAPENPQLAAAEIDRLAPDRRFVQVMLLAMAAMPLGRRFYWPIYEAAVRHDLPIAIHAGSSYRHAPTWNGWPSYLVEDYAAFAEAFQGQVLSLITEGVFHKFPNLRIVLAECGLGWLPAFLWRAVKTWRAMRVETPWVERSPADIIRSNFRFTLQPNDIPREGDILQKVLTQIGSEELILFSTDYPHWHFDGTAALPDGMSEEQIKRICVANPLATYPRLREFAT